MALVSLASMPLPISSEPRWILTAPTIISRGMCWIAAILKVAVLSKRRVIPRCSRMLHCIGSFGMPQRACLSSEVHTERYSRAGRSCSRWVVQATLQMSIPRSWPRSYTKEWLFTRLGRHVRGSSLQKP